MHIIIDLISGIAGLAWALYSLQNSGVNLNSFNPFFWARRRAWAKQVGTKPIHRLDNPMEIAAVLVVGIAKMEGEITREQKAAILTLFEQTFSMNQKQASEFYSASSYLLQDVYDINAEVKHIIAPGKAQFKEQQTHSTLDMLNQIAIIESPASDEQIRFITNVEAELLPAQQKNNW